MLVLRSEMSCEMLVLRTENRMTNNEQETQIAKMADTNSQQTAQPIRGSVSKISTNQLIYTILY